MSLAISSGAVVYTNIV